MFPAVQAGLEQQLGRYIVGQVVESLWIIAPHEQTRHPELGLGGNYQSDKMFLKAQINLRSLPLQSITLRSKPLRQSLETLQLVTCHHGLGEGKDKHPVRVHRGRRGRHDHIPRVRREGRHERRQPPRQSV